MFKEKLTHCSVRYKFTGQPDMLILFALYFVRFVTQNLGTRSHEAEEQTVRQFACDFASDQDEFMILLYKCYYCSNFTTDPDPAEDIAAFIEVHPDALQKIIDVVGRCESPNILRDPVNIPDDEVDAESGKYPAYIVRVVLNQKELDDTKDNRSAIQQMTPNEVFESVCLWEGFINYADTIKSWIQDIYGVNLDE